MHCSRYKNLDTATPKQYHPESFTQSGVCTESVKRTETPGVLEAIDAIASKMEIRAIKNDTITKSSKVHQKKRIYPSNSQTQSQRTTSHSHRCNCQISVLLWNDGFFYLDSRYTNLHHSGHPYIPMIAKKTGFC